MDKLLPRMSTARCGFDSKHLSPFPNRSVTSKSGYKLSIFSSFWKQRETFKCPKKLRHHRDVGSRETGVGTVKAPGDFKRRGEGGRGPGGLHCCQVLVCFFRQIDSLLLNVGFL